MTEVELSGPLSRRSLARHVQEALGSLPLGPGERMRVVDLWCGALTRTAAARGIQWLPTLASATVAQAVDPAAVQRALVAVFESISLLDYVDGRAENRRAPHSGARA